MVNIDDRLYKLVDGNEFWLLNHIVRRMNKRAQCWPSNNTLMKDTGWGMEKLQKVKKQLIDKGFVTVHPRRNDKGGLTSNVYEISTDLLGIFVPAKDFGLLTEEHPYAGKSGIAPPSEEQVDPYAGKSGNEVLAREEVLHADSKESAGNLPEKANQVELAFNGKKAVSKEKKGGGPVYVACVDFWLKKFHPDWSFSATDGKSMKGIIERMTRYSEKKNDGAKPTDEQLINFFQHFCLSLPEFFKTADLKTLNSKFDGIIDQIRTAGKPGAAEWHRATSAERIIDSL